jgi:hypothetical protein
MNAVNTLKDLPKTTLAEINMVFLIAGNLSIQTRNQIHEFDKMSVFFYQSAFTISNSSPYLKGFTLNLTQNFLAKHTQIKSYLPRDIEEFKQFKL